MSMIEGSVSGIPGVREHRVVEMCAIEKLVDCWELCCV